MLDAVRASGRRRPGRGAARQFYTVTFADAVRDGLARWRMEVVGQVWSPETGAEWVEEVRAQDLDCIPAAGDGAWLSWAQIHAVENPDGDPARYAEGRTVIGNDIARWRHLWVAWVLKLVGDIAWSREVVELRDASFATKDDEIDTLVERYRPGRIAMDQTGMGEKPVEDAIRRYGSQRVEGVLMTPATRLEIAGALKRRVEDIQIRIPKSTAIRQDLHAVRRAAGPTGAPRLVASDDTDGHADRFWAVALACGAAELEPTVYALHRVNNHADLRGVPRLGRPGAVRWRGMNGAL